MSIDRLLDDYELDVKSQGGSQKTVDSKRLATDLFAEYLGGIPDVRQVTADDFKRWLIHLQTEPGRSGQMLSPTAVNTYPRAVKRFWSWLLSTGRIRRNPLAGVKLPPPPDPETLPHRSHKPRDVNHVLDMAKRLGWDIRDPVILELIWDTGISAQQVSDLAIDGIDWQTGVIEAYRTKNRALPPMVTNRLTLDRLQHYIKHERPDVPGDRHLFLTRDGRPMSSHRVSQQLNRLGKKAGLSRPLGPHSMRHSFGAHSLPFTTVEEVQRMMGHKSATTTRGYARPGLEYQARVHDQASPVLNYRYRPREVAGRSIKSARAGLPRTVTPMNPSPGNPGTGHAVSDSHGRQVPVDRPLTRPSARELLDKAIRSMAEDKGPGGRVVMLPSGNPRVKKLGEQMDKVFGPRIKREL